MGFDGKPAAVCAKAIPLNSIATAEVNTTKDFLIMTDNFP
jgi:hypothetical protein